MVEWYRRNGRKAWVTWAIVLAVFFLYSVIFFLLHPLAGSSMAAAAILPVLVSGWVLGIRGGALAGMLAILLNTILLNVAGQTGLDVVLREGGGPGSLVILLSGIGAGYGRLLYRRHLDVVAARHQAEAGLRQRDRHFRVIFEKSPLGMSLVDAETRFVRVNSHLCKMLGYSTDEMLERSFVDITHPEDVQEDLDQAEALVAGEISGYDMEKRYRRKDGTIFWVHLTVTMIRDERDGVDYFLGMVEDIDERKAAEARTVRRNRELRLLNRIVAAGTAKLEAKAVLETACRELAKAFSLPRAEAALLDDSGQMLEVVAEYVREDGVGNIGAHIPLAELPSIEGMGDENQIPAVAGAQPGVLPDPAPSPAERQKRASTLLLPLQVNGQVAGTLSLVRERPQTFSEEEVELARTAASAASQILEKAELLQRTREQAAQLAALRDVQLAISNSLEPATVYEAIVENAARLVGCPSVCLYQWQEQDGRYVRLAHYGEVAIGPECGSMAPLAPRPEQFAGQDSMILPTPDGEQGKWTQGESIFTSLLVPLRYRNQLTGFLALLHTEGEHHWSKEEIGLAESLTAQAAIAVANAQLHAQTRADAETLQQLLDTIPDGVVLLNAAQRVIMANPPALEYLELLGGRVGQALERLGGIPLPALLQPPPPGDAAHEVRSANEKARIFMVRVETMAPGLVLVLRDVTLEREQQRQLQAQERLAAVGKLSAGIAHDFNNILAVIVLYTEMLQRDHLPEKAREQIGVVHEQARRASQLVQQILDFSRKAIMKRRQFDLLPFLRDQVNLMERTLPESIQITFTHEAPSYRIDADETRLQQAIMNLAVNARDAMPDGGELRLALARRQPAQEPVPAGGWISIEVSDDGMGIAPEHRPHIFEPFFTTKEPGKGSGLGLAQVYGIVKQHEGHIEVESSPAVGTTITLFFPALPEEAHPPETTPLVKERWF